MSDTLIRNKTSTKSKAEKKPFKEKRYRVVLLNDNYTHMEFVVLVLEKFFDKNRTEAMGLMLLVHNTGRGVCGIYSKQIAETKVAQVKHFAAKHKQPLACVMEELED